MPEKNLVSLTLDALNELARLEDLQQLLEIALEQQEELAQSRRSRVDTLISVYLPQAQLRLEALNLALEQLRLLLRGSG